VPPIPAAKVFGQNTLGEIRQFPKEDALLAYLIYILGSYISSPMMLTIVTAISVDKSISQPVYLQISNQLMLLIREGNLKSGQRLPSTRQMAESLSVHRKTVVQAYDELLSQGWLESHTGSGTFISNNLPEAKPQFLEQQGAADKDPLHVAGYAIRPAPHLEKKPLQPKAVFHLDDGFPDARMAPLIEISRAYRTQLLMGNPYQRLGYGDTLGSLWLRQELSAYLNETRGLRTTPKNILITRGTIMGLYLASQSLIESGNHVVVTEMGWSAASMNFIEAGANLHTVPADKHGIDLDALENICRTKPVRLVYVTSHHHYPTTFILRADRRLGLLALAEKFGFIIFEDDYDYDFHYQSKPLLPLAGADRSGVVLYCGSFTKTISPAFRVGYLVGSENVIDHLAKFRRIIDRQGDLMLENAIAELLKNGTLQRHLRKSLRVYRERRDVFCELLRDQLGEFIDFDIPEGGMAVWTKFDSQINLKDLSKKALQNDLFFSEGAGLHKNPALSNGTRMGFASSTADELSRSVEILRKLLIDNP
jgi:GntR family transcriptional regulator/MocR family aminotransferase